MYITMPWIIVSGATVLIVIVALATLFIKSRDASADSESHKKELAVTQKQLEATNNQLTTIRAELSRVVEEQNYELARKMAMYQEAESALLKETQLKSSFLANTSHEIRTPLNTIVGVTNILLREDSFTKPERVKDGLDKIYTACEFLLGVIDDILDLSKIEVGKMDILSEEYNIIKLLSDTIQLHSSNAKAGVEFGINVSPDIPLRLVGDELRIKQILSNLLSNAFKYTDRGGVMLRVSTRRIAGSLTAELVLEVSDTGNGMTKNQLGKIFDEYSRFNKGSGSVIQGSGLGLAVVQRLVELMNGEIDVKSDPEKGSTFTINLPQGITDNDVLGDKLAQSLMNLKPVHISQSKFGIISHALMPHGNVLVVDDMESNIFVAEGLLNLYAIKVDTAVSGAAAIEKIKRGAEYDIIFMDHMMPGMDGIEAFKRIRALGYTAPVVALTANAIKGNEEMFLKNGFDAFISKPIDLLRLDTVLNKYIPAADEVKAKAADTFLATKSRAELKIPRMLLVECFIKDAEKSLSELKRLTEVSGFDGFVGAQDNEHINKELGEYTLYIHGIKSSLHNIGEESMTVLALELESAARAGDAECIKNNTPLFLDALSETLIQCKAEVSQDESGAMMSEEEVCRAFMQIIKACNAFSRKDALNVISETELCHISDEAADALKRMKDLVIETEFDKAAQIAKAYLI
ncbi:MAG: ATP-binding protein [Oscillospiraceae bacterium]|nr:ATP-binding protein [Oscillospiraceae bacterium]